MTAETRVLPTAATLTVPVAEVRLDCAWPRGAPASVLRGAILAQLRAVHGEGLHSDWHGHLDDDPRGGMSRPAPVCYRVVGGPQVYLWGERAWEHARLLGGVRSLRLSRGEVLEVAGVEVDVRTDPLHVCRRWTRWETVTPLYPARVAWARRPREPGPERDAWLGACLRRCILDVIESAGGGDYPNHPLHVHVVASKDGRVDWRGVETVAATHARFICNADLPDGIGLGHHRFEGWGEIRCCGRGERW